MNIVGSYYLIIHSLFRGYCSLLLLNNTLFIQWMLVVFITYQYTVYSVDVCDNHLFFKKVFFLDPRNVRVEG